jgi:ankyrin repeat protein
MASNNSQCETVRQLFKHDMVDVNLQTNSGDTALILAIQKCCKDIADTILKHDKVDVNLQR